MAWWLPSERPLFDTWFLHEIFVEPLHISSKRPLFETCQSMKPQDIIYERLLFKSDPTFGSVKPLDSSSERHVDILKQDTIECF